MRNKKINKKLNSHFKKTMKKHKGNKKAQVITLAFTIIISAAIAFFGKDLSHTDFNKVLGQANGTLQIHYLDVGQGDSTYIKVNDMDILIDAGPKSDADKLMAQLKAFNIDDFEIVIATHAHEDHIGGMTKVFDNYKVESFYMPKTNHTTKTFENMLKAVNKQGLKVTTLKGGMNIDLGAGANFNVYSPNADSYEELNDYSPIMKLNYGDSSFMFTGDAEVLAEKEVLQKYPKELKADVLKLGHHGSTTSSSEEFIKAINPKYGVISCGVDNSYGHPHKEILSLMNKYNIKIYRTDKQGQITVTSDGKNITFKSQK